MLMPGALIIGIGNRYRNDDGVGLVVARLVGTQVGDDCEIIAQSGEGASLIEAWQGGQRVWLIDAVAGDRPGQIHRFDAIAQPLPSHFFRYSTHAFSVAEAIELARTLNRLPAHLIVYGIEAENFQAGTTLTDTVTESANRVVTLIKAELYA